MRTTVEISGEQHRALTMLAQQRGVRGFSLLVQEALDTYLHDLGDEEIGRLLELEGSLGDEDEARLRAGVEAVRETWRAS